MTFRETLDKHVHAIQERNLQGFIDTLAEEELVLITAEGHILRSSKEVIEMHRAWFASPTWTLGARLESVYETPDMGVAVLHLDHRDAPPGGPAAHETSYLTLVFRRRPDGRWVMVQDQNTPIKRPPG